MFMKGKTMNIFLIVQEILDSLRKACELLSNSKSSNKEKFEKIRNMNVGDDIRYVADSGCYNWFLTFHAAKELYEFCKKQEEFQACAEWLKPICEILMKKEYPAHKSGNQVFVSKKTFLAMPKLQLQFGKSTIFLKTGVFRGRLLTNSRMILTLDSQR